MKKRITAFLALITAFVIGFSLIACGTTPDGPGGDNEHEKPEGPGIETEPPDNEDPAAGMTEKAVAAINGLLKCDGFKGSVSFDYSSKSNKAIDFDATVEKRGNRAEAVVAGDGAPGYTVDLDNGYVYTLGGDGEKTIVDYKSYFPAGTLDYVKTVLSGYVGEDGSVDLTEFDKKIDYDKAEKTITYAYDGKGAVNGALEPLYEAYRKNSDLTTLLDNYFMHFTDGEMSFTDNPRAETSFAAVVATYAELLGTQTVESINETFKDAGIDLKTILEENGINIRELLKTYGVEITEEQFKARTLGQMVVGAYNALTSGTATLDGESDGGDASGITQMLPVILKGMFADEADGSKIKEVVDNVFALIKSFTNGIKTDALVGMLENYVPELAAAVKANVCFTKLDTEFSLKFDDDYRLKEMKISGELAHDFTGATDGFTFLADNDYKIGLQIKVTEYLSNPAAFDHKYAAGLAVQPTSVIVVGKAEKDVEVWIDLAGNDVALELDPVEVMQYGNYAEFKNGKLIVKASFINDWFKNAEFGDTKTVPLAAAGGAFTVNVNVIYMTADVRDAAEYILGLIRTVTPPDGVQPAGGSRYGKTELCA